MRESLLAFSMACLCRSGPEKDASRMDMPRGKSPDFHSLTLRIELSMNAVYQSMPSTIAAAANNLRWVERQLLTHAPVRQRIYGGVNMKLLGRVNTIAEPRR
jgi:hypothetical protein